MIPFRADALLVDLWGISPDTWTPTNSNVQYTINDEAPDGTGSSFYLNPGYGGQPYDAEALFTLVDDTYLYISMVTGFQPQGRYDGSKFYIAGDLILDMDGDGTHDHAIRAGATLGTPTPGGTLFRGVTDWTNVLIPAHSAAGPLQALTYTDAIFYNSNASITYEHWQGTHYAFEAIIPLLDLGYDQYSDFDFGIRWTMACGNDFVNYYGSVDTPIVPEPSSFLLLFSGLLSLLGLKRRKTA